MISNIIQRHNFFESFASIGRVDLVKQGFKYFFVAAVSVTWATRGRTCWGSPSTTCCTPTACGSSSPSTGSVGRYKDAGKGDRRSMRNCVQRTLIRLLFPFKFCLNLTADPPPRPFQMCINCVHSLHHHHYLFLQLGAATCQ